jgi:4-hydroxy-3-polyprenylbenzoate decarboxylase
MAYKSLQQCITDLEKQGELLRIPKQVNPDLEMAGMQLDEFSKGGKGNYF